MWYHPDDLGDYVCDPSGLYEKTIERWFSAEYLNSPSDLLCIPVSNEPKQESPKPHCTSLCSAPDFKIYDKVQSAKNVLVSAFDPQAEKAIA